MRHEIAFIGYGLDCKVMNDVADIDDADRLSNGELAEIAAEAGDNYGHGTVYHFQYGIDESGVMIAKQGRTLEFDIICGIGIVTTAHREESCPEINHSNIVSVDWKVTFEEGGVNIDVGSDPDSIEAYTLDTLDPGYYHDLTSEPTDKENVDRDELLALVFDELS